VVEREMMRERGTIVANNEVTDRWRWCFIERATDREREMIEIER